MAKQVWERGQPNMRCPKSISLRIITLVRKISRFSDTMANLGEQVKPNSKYLVTIFLDLLSSNISRHLFHRGTYAPSRVTTCRGWTASPMNRHCFCLFSAAHNLAFIQSLSHNHTRFKHISRHCCNNQSNVNPTCWVYVALVDKSLVHASMLSPTVYPLHWIHLSKEKSGK